MMSNEVTAVPNQLKVDYKATSSCRKNSRIYKSKLDKRTIFCF